MIKIAICDDSAMDLERVSAYVEGYLKETKTSAEVRKYSGSEELIKDCETFRPHLYVLDIVMPESSGIEAARNLKWNQKDTQVIFVTSEKSFALESFDVNPTDYLVKPVDKNRLYESLDRAIRSMELVEDTILTVKTKGGFSAVKLDNILFIEYRNHLVTYWLLNGESVSTTTLRVGFPEYLSAYSNIKEIVQCHESFAVNVAMVDKLTKTEAYLRGGDCVPVSKSKYDSISSAYLDYRFGE